MTTFAALFLAHLIADFPLQTDRIYKLKSESSRGIAIHVAVHILVAAILIERPFQHLPLLLVLALIHFTIDWSKIHWHTRRQTPGFLLDQLTHFISILLIALWQPNVPVILPLWLLWLDILLSLIPALMTLFWVWATDLRVDLPDNRTVNWASRTLLSVSQQLGSLFVIILVLTSLPFLV
jgi:hypothetical protein